MTSRGSEGEARRAESERLHTALLRAALLDAGLLDAALLDTATGGLLSAARFEAFALDVARFQAQYRSTERTESPRKFAHIMPLTADVFRVARVAVHPPEQDSSVFRTSGTTGSASGAHPFRDTRTMEQLSVQFGREMLLGGAGDAARAVRWTVANLAPALHSEPQSSLGFMLAAFARHFDGRSWELDGAPLSAVAASSFDGDARWLVTAEGVDVARLELAVNVARSRGEPLLLCGTSFAFVTLLDLLGSGTRLPLPSGSRLMTTGGTKGRVRATTSRELRTQLAAVFQVPAHDIIAEYGMTELSSQLYARPDADGSDGVFLSPPWLRVEAVDPISFQPVPDGTHGLACFTDLANIDSAVRVVTQDMVVRERGGVRLLGRRAGAPLRGCSLRFDTAAPIAPGAAAVSPTSDVASPSAGSERPPVARSSNDAAEDRVRRLIDAARRIADPHTELGARARAAFVTSTGLSAEGVEYALASCLETDPSDGEIAALLDSVPRCSRAHVVLSSTVFTAALRAIAVALAASPRVAVKPSRREGELARFLAAETPGLFELRDALRVEPGDAVWAYGSDENLSEIRRSLPAGVHLLAHGSGMGLAAVRGGRELAEAARLLALDTLAFDQRGCLSPRVVAFDGAPAEAEQFASLVAAELTAAGRRVPLGHRTNEELAELVWYGTTLSSVGVETRVTLHATESAPIRIHSSLFPVVGSSAGAVLVPPPGRNLHVVAAAPLVLYESLRGFVTCIGCSDAVLAQELEARCPDVRVVPLGSMQRPPLDGVVDRRATTPLRRR